MASRKQDSRERSNRMVKFASTEADQFLLQLVEQALEERSVSFSDLCKQALQRFLRSSELPQSVPLAQPSAVHSAINSGVNLEVNALHNQMDALRLQIAKLEGAFGMYQTVSLGQVEQKVGQIEQQMTTQLAHVLDRLARLEQLDANLTLTPDIETSKLDPIDFTKTEPSPEELQEVDPLEVDPLLTRLAPLLEDF